MSRVCLAVLCVTLGVMACRSEPSRKAVGASSAAVASASAAPVASVAAPPAISKERVESVIERWRVAQESGDFEAYSALYAPSFRGVKLVGESRASFDRAGWLRDRRQMFQRDMKVGVSAVKVVTGERTAFVTFV